MAACGGEFDKIDRIRRHKQKFEACQLMGYIIQKEWGIRIHPITHESSCQGAFAELTHGK
jgi:hypothetical protein